MEVTRESLLAVVYDPADGAEEDAPAPVSGLPLPIVTTDELLSLLGPLTDAERLAVDLAELDAPTDPAA
jgi:hypothetical protein